MKVGNLAAGGWVVTLGAVALIAGLVKAGVQAEVGDAPNMSPAAPYSIWEVLTWAGVGAASGLVAYLAPNAFGLHQATVAAPFFICATVVGFLLGTQYVCTPSTIILALLSRFSERYMTYQVEHCLC